jgi:predicted dinucleotide-binding enzyme
MADSKKFDIIYKRFAKPIADLKMTYESSALTVENKVVSNKVVKKFNELMGALVEQLDSYR